MQNERSKTKADVEKFAIGDADDEDDDENDSDDHESNDEELTEDYFRSANAGGVGAMLPPFSPRVPPIWSASQNVFSSAADRGAARSASAHPTSWYDGRASSRAETRGPVGLGGIITGNSSRREGSHTVTRPSQARQRSMERPVPGMRSQLISERAPQSTESQRAADYQNGLRPDRAPAVKTVPEDQRPLTEAEMKAARVTQDPALMRRLEYNRTKGRNDPMVPTGIAHQAQPDKAQSAMVEQFANFYASMAPLTGHVGLTKEQILSNMCPSIGPPIDPNHPVNVDVPYVKPGPDHVDTQCRRFVPAGTRRFEVHNMDGIVPGQILSIGYEGHDLEHFKVARLGSVEAEEEFVNDHDELSPVKLIRASKKVSPNVASGIGGSGSGIRIPRRSADDSDVELGPPKDTHTVTNRKFEWPYPLPTGHTDVEERDHLWLNYVCLDNPLNHERERTYWEKCFQCSVNDPRLSESWTPSDMLQLEAIIREKIKKIAEAIHGGVLLDRMTAEENAWWSTTRRTLPSRKLMAMYYENFRIAGTEINAMYMQEFSLINYDHYGDKNAA